MCHVFFPPPPLSTCITAEECCPDNIKACRPLNMAGKPSGQGSKRVISSKHKPSLRPWHFFCLVLEHISQWLYLGVLINTSAALPGSISHSTNTNHELSVPISISLHNNIISTAAPKLYQTDLITDFFSCFVFFFPTDLNCTFIACLHCKMWKFRTEMYRKMIPFHVFGWPDIFYSLFPHNPIIHGETDAK